MEYTVFEGMISVRALIASVQAGSNDRKIYKILLTEGAEKANPKLKAYLSHRASELGFEIVTASEEEVAGYTTGKSHGGIAALCGERTIPLLTDCSTDGRFYVMLSGIEDPYNFGYALRSLYAAGVDGIILEPRNWMSAAGTVCRSSAGASELFDIFLADGVTAAEYFKNKGFSVYCADMKNSVSIYETEFDLPLFLIVGGEKRGISAKVRSVCDKALRLDYGRDFPEALSAASAASIISFEIMRRTGLYHREP
ncbi:MAG: RNA methyltransferase [Clostridia bacterium]|nr:RNA methyltransferase [Clostridia bacterium]